MAECSIEPVAKLVETGELKGSFRHVGVAHATARASSPSDLGKADDFTPETRTRRRRRGDRPRGRDRRERRSAGSCPTQADPATVAGAIVEGTILKTYPSTASRASATTKTRTATPAS